MGKYIFYGIVLYLLYKVYNAVKVIAKASQTQNQNNTKKDNYEFTDYEELK